MRMAATATVSALSLALVTGCGGDSGSADTKNSSAGKGSSSTTAAKAYTTAELRGLVIATGDVDGYDIRSADTADKYAVSKDLVKVTDARCAPLGYIITGFAPGDTTSYVHRMATEASDRPTPTGTSDEDLENAMNGLDDFLNSTMTIVSLSSYDGEGAEETMKSVSAAVSGCASGFTISAKGQDTQKFTKVAEEKSSATADESVAFEVTGKAEGEDQVVHGVVARHGSTIATYYSISLAAMAGQKSDYGVPAEVIKAQAAKLK